MAPLIWTVILAITLGYEFYTLRDQRRGDTLSEQVWALMRTTEGRATLIPLWVWLTYHFFIEPNYFKSVFLVNYIDDIILVSVTLVVTVVYNIKRGTNSLLGGK